MRYSKFLILFLVAGIAFSCDESFSSDTFSNGPSGQSGSMTRFAISGNYMYVVDNSNIKVFEIGEGKFEALPEVSIGFGMETIFAKGEFLYLGANDAMYIYSIANPASPSFVFRYAHIISCDPVIVQGNRAYVTLSSGSRCNRGTNALEIIDITDPYNPQLVKNYPMESPNGLGIDGNLLFICERDFGLKVFDVSNEMNIKLVATRSDFFAYDVILRQGLATITGEDGIFQLSYGSNGAITLVSKIPVTRPQL